MKELIRKARLKYDYIIIDTPPCMLVSDTFTLSPLSDLVVYVARANLTRKDSMKFVKESILLSKLKNVGLVLNAVGETSKYGYKYSYSYAYNYQYKYKYSYNYGYGYGYSNDD